MLYINIPQDVFNILNKLEQNGYQAYIVGGCVRDSLMGKKPYDIDIATSALPQEIKEVFSTEKIIETGIAHGTITLIYNNKQYEITTFRTDGEYKDNRHPDGVCFVKTIKEDLSRRDFTVNAIAYSQARGICDEFDGQKDIKDKVIRCVGEPNKRFNEDGLRILRALRFASTLGFEIEKNTSESIMLNRNLLINISAERISQELKKLIMGVDVFKIMTEYRDVIAVIIPELVPCFDFNQHTKHHSYSVYDHIIKSVEQAPQDLNIRLCMLFHDINKPQTFHSGVSKGHFKGHQIPSAETAVRIMKRLKLDNNTIKEVKDLIIEHDNRYPCEKKSVKKYISNNGYDFFKKQLMVRKADTLAQSMYKREEKLKTIEMTEILGDKIIKEGKALTLKALNINGNDLKPFCSPKEIGKILNSLLSLVIDEKIENEKIILLDKAKKLIKKSV